MKLNELGAQRQTKTIARVFEAHLGKRLDFENLGAMQAQHMLRRVRSLVNEHKQTTAFHSSERDPSYLKLVMMEQALTAHLYEVGYVPPAPGGAPAGQPGAQPGAAPANPANMAMNIAQRKKQLQDQLKAAQEQVRAIQQQLSQPNLGMAESTHRRRISESEIQQAQVVLAAQDMVDRVQKMTEEISEMQFKDLPALANSIKNDMGTEQATAFQSQASAALSTLLSAVQQGKTQLEAAQGTITGDAGPIVPGEEEVGDLAGDALDDLDAADVEVDAEADVEEPDLSDMEASPETLGRDRR